MIFLHTTAGDLVEGAIASDSHQGQLDVVHGHRVARGDMECPLIGLVMKNQTQKTTQ